MSPKMLVNVAFVALRLSRGTSGPNSASLTATMASSLSEECTPLKQEYDACFNSWFEGYLEPLTNGKDAAAREKHTRAKAEEYERNCGKVWKSYRDCVQVYL